METPVAQNKPGILIVFGLFGWYLASLIGAVIVTAGIALLQGKTSGEDALTMNAVIGITVYLTVAAGAAAFGAGVLNRNVSASLGLGPIQRWSPVLAATLFIIAMERNFDSWAHWIDGGEPSSIDSLISAASATKLGMLCVATALNAVAMELLFRGFMQRRLAQRWGIWWSVSVVAVLTGVGNLSLGDGLLGALIGAAAGLAVVSTGSTWAAVIPTVLGELARLLASRAGAPFEQMRPDGLISVVILSSGYFLVREAINAVGAAAAQKAKAAAAADSAQSATTHQRS